MIAETIRVSMNLVELVIIVGGAFALGALLGLWISR